jgi:hypothetical protein
MSPRLYILLFLALSIHAARAAIDFTPTVKEYSAEGFTYRQLTFKNDEGGATLNPPQKWLIRGGKDQLQLSPPDKSFVEMTIQTRPLPAPQSFDEASVKAFEQLATREIPPGSQSIQLLKREENPVALDKDLSLEFVISYQVLGQTFQRSVIFVNSADQQLIFRFTAPKADFVALKGEFLRSINSWQWIKWSATSAGGTAPASK